MSAYLRDLLADLPGIVLVGVVTLALPFAMFAWLLQVVLP